jgi:ATP-binding cassette subfamily B protein
MSGGERQRIGLARAFAHGGRLLILDDATSSLDTVTEHQVARALTGELRDRTRLIVAHRATTAARADLVVWLDAGRVRAAGPHRVLWQDPAYRAIFEITAPTATAPAQPSAVTTKPGATEPGAMQPGATQPSTTQPSLLTTEPRHGGMPSSEDRTPPAVPGVARAGRDTITVPGVSRCGQGR